MARGDEWAWSFSAAVSGMPSWTRWKISRSRESGRSLYSTSRERGVRWIGARAAAIDAPHVMSLFAKSSFHDCGIICRPGPEAVYQYDLRVFGSLS